MTTAEAVIEVVRELLDRKARDEEAAYWEWHYSEGQYLRDDAEPRPNQAALVAASREEVR